MQTGTQTLPVTDEDDVRARLGSPDRAAAMQRARLIGSVGNEIFDRATEMAARLLDAPVAHISIVDELIQYFPSMVGVGEPYASTRRMPLNLSYCKYVAANELPLAVEDASLDPLLATHDALREVDAVGYCGTPLREPGGQTLGALCVVTNQPRQWSKRDLAVLRELGQFVEAQLELNDQRHAAAEQHRAQQDAYAVVTHDIRGPLASIASAAALLTSRADLDADSVNRLLTSIRQTASDALEFADRLLDAQGRTPAAVIDEVDAAALVRRIVERIQLAEQNADITVSAPESIVLKTDELMVDHIVTNFIRNGLVHGGTTPTIDVDVAAHDEAIAINVSDNGPGVDEQQLAQLFEAFRKGPESTGSGLGLHIAKSLADELGATIDVASTPNEGATFSLHLPIR